MDRCDVVVVGGGIAGSALGAVAARQGLTVLVLERQVAYRDRVRGEYLAPWGAVEARQLGLDGALLAGGGTWITRAVQYDELVPPAVAEAHEVPLGAVRPDAPGAMDLSHPGTCQALADAAVAHGARVARGVGDVVVHAGPRPSVRYELDDVEHEVACRLVVAADGRASGVRRQLGLELCQTTPRTMVCGLLVEGLDSWPADRMSLGTEGDLHHLVFPRRDGVARLYQVFDVAQRERFSGPDRQRDVLESFRLDCLPQGDAIAAATPAGPVASYPGNDSLVADPVVPGVVLVGDAAGWNDPIIGQGLSIALRDVRLVTEVLATTCDWGPAAFAGYADERRRRMHRLRTCAELETDVRADFTPAGRRRRAAVMAAMREDPLVAGALTVTALAGPDAAPPEAFAPANVARIKALV